MSDHHNRHNAGNDDDNPDGGPTPERAAQQRMRAARYWIAVHCPYYMTALFRCPLRTTGHTATVARRPPLAHLGQPGPHQRSDRSPRPPWRLMHVLNHALRGHHRRAQHAVADPFLALAWNVAADCEINDDLLDGLAYRTAELPHNWPAPWKLSWPDSQTAETYYRDLTASDRIDPDHRRGRLDRRPTRRDPPHQQRLRVRRHRHNPPLGTPSRHRHAQRNRSAHAAPDASHKHALDHEQRDPDSVPEGLLRWPHEQISPQVDWRRALAAALRRAAPPPNRRRRLHLDPAPQTPQPAHTRRGDPAACDQPPRPRSRCRRGHLRFHGRRRPRPRRRRDRRHLPPRRARPPHRLLRRRHRHPSPPTHHRHPPAAAARRRRHRHGRRHQHRRTSPAHRGHRAHRRAHTLARPATTKPGPSSSPPSSASTHPSATSPTGCKPSTSPDRSGAPSGPPRSDPLGTGTRNLGAAHIPGTDAFAPQTASPAARNPAILGASSPVLNAPQVDAESVLDARESCEVAPGASVDGVEQCPGGMRRRGGLLVAGWGCGR